jgi:protein-S-isoprenylcysteine O-methyltransferase Ste14
MKLSALIVTAIPAVAAPLLIVRFWQPPWTALRIAGLILTVAGTTALTVARFQLGNSFTIRAEANELVTSGLYAKIRNPVYIFSAVLVGGMLLYVDQPKWFWIFLILIPVQLIRARAEARVLEDRFGDVYRQYRSHTWF